MLENLFLKRHVIQSNTKVPLSENPPAVKILQ